MSIVITSLYYLHTRNDPAEKPGCFLLSEGKGNVTYRYYLIVRRMILKIQD